MSDGAEGWQAYTYCAGLARDAEGKPLINSVGVLVLCNARIPVTQRLCPACQNLEDASET